MELTIQLPETNLAAAIKELGTGEQADIIIAMLMEADPTVVANVLRHLGSAGCGFYGTNEVKEEADAIKEFVSSCYNRWDKGTLHGDAIRAAFKEQIATEDEEDAL